MLTTTAIVVIVGRHNPVAAQSSSEVGVGDVLDLIPGDALSFQSGTGEVESEIEVTDPTHPLFGRRFSVLSISSPPQGLGHVFVVYQAHITLCIPLSATNLTPPRPTGQTKLTLSAVTDLISLVEQREVLCQLHQQMSGSECLQNSKLKSPTTSRRSFRR